MKEFWQLKNKNKEALIVQLRDASKFFFDEVLPGHLNTCAYSKTTAQKSLDVIPYRITAHVGSHHYVAAWIVHGWYPVGKRKESEANHIYSNSRIKFRN